MNFVASCDEALYQSSLLYRTFFLRLHKHGYYPRFVCLVEAYKCVAVILVSVLFEVQKQQAAIRTSPIYFGLVVYLILSIVGEQCVLFCFFRADAHL